MFVVAGLSLLFGLGQTTLHYSLPSPTGVTRHSASYGPGVLSALVAGVVTALAAAWLVFVVLRRATRWMLIAMITLIVVDLVVLVVVSGLSRPTF